MTANSNFMQLITEKISFVLHKINFACPNECKIMSKN